MLASSGKVDMYTLQKLLTHKSPMMTQRYAHLRDETLRSASELAGEIIGQAMKTENEAEAAPSERQEVATKGTPRKRKLVKRPQPGQSSRKT
jgi:hypothetical protein